MNKNKIKFEEIKSYKVVGTNESVVMGEWNKGDGLDVVVEVNGKVCEYWYTNLKARNKIKQIEKYFVTGKNKEKGERYFNELKKEGWELIVKGLDLS